MDSFNLMSNKDNGIQHMIAGKAVCKNAFIVYFKISNQRYERIFKQFTENPTLKIQRKPVIRSDSTKVTEAKAWIARYFKRIGDSMPHVEQTHLPHGLTKQDVYLTMKQELSQQGVMSTISLSHFYAIWDTSFSNVLIPKHNLFSKCNICTMYNKERLLLSKERLEELKAKYQLHLENVERERKKYYHH